MAWMSVLFLLMIIFPVWISHAETPVDLLFDEQDSVITATESQRVLGQVPAIVTVITEKQIRDMGAHTLIEVLDAVPGMNVSYPMDLATGHTLTVRGLKSSEAEKTLLMINGHRVNNPYSGSWTFLFDEFPLNDVRRIEIIRGPGSALYGSNAMAAVIHVITKSGEDFRGSGASVAAGNHNTQLGHIRGGSKKDNRNILLSLNASSTDGDRLMIPSDAAGATGLSNFWRKQQSAFLSASSGNLSLFAMHINKRRGSVLDGSNRIDQSTNVAIRQSAVAVAWKLSGDDWDAELRTDADLFDLDPQWQMFGGAQTLRPQVKDLTLSARALLRYRGWEMQEWTISLAYEHIRQFGVHMSNNGLDVSTLFNHNRNAVRQVPALVIQNEWSPLPQLSITTGIRIERYSDVGSHVSPRFAAIWSPMSSLDIKAMYGHAFRAPSFVELYSSNNPTVQGNPNISPETVDTIELGGSFHDGLWRLDSGIFYSRYKRQITRISPSPLTVNVGRTNLRGFEVELRADVKKGLYGSLAYTWQRSSNDLTSQQLPGVSVRMIKFSGDVPLPLDTHLHTDLRWMGPQSRDLGDTRPPVGAIWLANLALRTGNPVDGLSTSVTVRNLFNRKVYSPITVPGMSDLTLFDRQWMVNLAYEF
ncbi:TonB-dependent receptor [Mariprofundus sp. EBB-1]|uniref:TonB-dependent receptor plug domain-containing protein n=1 Tax=Mariprofundus sp. EBB-1 TaxID=2650971 RepID=UPI000EF18729|nr:TonB-dependent receptor [Mariprofundus sp. EBB-1]RLL51928.1 TonB-dependent receptor [Mariprofundus sp. EBB-1]